MIPLDPPPSPNRSEHPYKGSLVYQGLRILVENPAGTVRRGTAPDGRAWATTMTAHYGEFAGTKGVDGDPVDVFVGDDPEAPMAYVVHRKHPGTEVYDEDKVILGVRSVESAEALFRANYDRPGNLGGITPWPLDELREYLAHPAHEGQRLDRPERVRRAMRKGGPIAGRPGLHLDPMKHRWVRDADVVPGAEFPSPLGDLRVEDVADGRVTVRPARGGSAVSMPRSSGAHFFNDLAGSLAGHTPTSGHAAVDGAIRDGEWIGKGNDGIVFRHGDKAVKVSTTVPYQPFNLGHRTPPEAAAHLQAEATAHEALGDLPLVPSVESVHHEGRTWLVKPWLDGPGKLTEAEAEAVRDEVRTMHERGWVLGDDVQLGRDEHGALKLMDLGQARPSTRENDRERDEENLEALFHEHGHRYMPTGARLARVESGERNLLEWRLDALDDHPEKNTPEERQRIQARYERWRTYARRRKVELLNAGEREALVEMRRDMEMIDKRAEALGLTPLHKGVFLVSLAQLRKAAQMGLFGGETPVDPRPRRRQPAGDGRQHSLFGAPPSPVAPAAAAPAPPEASPPAPASPAPRPAPVAASTSPGQRSAKLLVKHGDAPARTHDVSGSLEDIGRAAQQHLGGPADAGRAGEHHDAAVARGSSRLWFKGDLSEEEKHAVKGHARAAPVLAPPAPAPKPKPDPAPTPTTKPPAEPDPVAPLAEPPPKRPKPPMPFADFTDDDFDKLDADLTEQVIQFAVSYTKSRNWNASSNADARAANEGLERARKTLGWMTLPNGLRRYMANMDGVPDYSLLSEKNGFRPHNDAVAGKMEAELREKLPGAIRAARGEELDAKPNVSKPDEKPAAPKPESQPKPEAPAPPVPVPVPEPEPKPEPAPAPKPPTEPPGLAGLRPPGLGWLPIPGSKHGGMHRKKPDGTGYDYWYPDLDTSRHHPKDHAEINSMRRDVTLAHTAVDTIDGHPSQYDKQRALDRALWALDVTGHGRAAGLGTQHVLREARDRIQKARVELNRSASDAEPSNDINASSRLDQTPAPTPASTSAPAAERAPAGGGDKGGGGGRRGRAEDLSNRKVHHDVGEKIGGARKDKWVMIHGDNLADVEADGVGTAYKLVTKAKVLGDIDHQRNKDQGDTPAAAAMKQVIWDAIGGRPSVEAIPTGLDWKKVASMLGTETSDKSADSPLARALYVSAIEKLKRGMDACHTVAEVDDWLRRRRIESANGAYVTEERITNSHLSGVLSGYRHRAYNSNDPTTWNAERVSAYVDTGAGSVSVSLDRAKLEADGYKVATRRDPYGGTKSYLLKMATDPAVRWRPVLEVAVLGKRFYDGLMMDRGAVSTNMAKAKRVATWDALIPPADAPAVAPAGDKKPKQAPFVIPSYTGPRLRTGGKPVPSNLDGKAFADTFGLRAVEYGNWISDADAVAHLTEAHGAFLDLADLMQIEPKHLALGGKLGIAFGARGQGGKNAGAAHYEPDRMAINITHENGAGSLAHEWGHFLDHVLAGGGHKTMGAKRRAANVSHADATTDLHPEVRKAFDGVMSAIRGRKTGQVVLPDAVQELRRQIDAERNTVRNIADHTARSEAIRAFNAKVNQYNADVAWHTERARSSKFLHDATALGEYWARPHELFARAFESWAEDKVRGQSRHSTYLVSGTRRKIEAGRLVNGVARDGLEPYPHDDERVRIHAAIDKLVDTMASTGALRKALQRHALRLGVRSSALQHSGRPA